MPALFGRFQISTITMAGFSLLGFVSYYPRFNNTEINAKSKLDIDIPTFSVETDWNSLETKNKLSIAIEKYGFAYFEMTQKDQMLYKSVYSTILPFFHETEKYRKQTYLPNQDLNFSKWREKNIFYGYVNYQTIEPFQQCRCFMMPMQSLSTLSDVDVLNHNQASNPFTKDNDDIIEFAESLSNHASTLLYHILGHIINVNDEDFNDYFSQILGRNPAKHFGINYFDPNELNKNIKYGIVEHKDSDFISVLALSDNGLQIKFENEWIDIDYHPNKFIVNFGTMFELLTNGKVKAVQHKVKIIDNKERLSFGIFLNGDLEGNVYKFENHKLKPIKSVLQHFQDSFDDYLSDTKDID